MAHGKWTSILDVDRLTSILQRRCESHGVSLEWTSNQNTAMTDGQRIILPIIHQPVTKAAMDKLYGYVIHECGHHSRPEAFDILRSAKPPQALAAIYNIVEDDGMEREVANTHRGDAKALGQQNAQIIKEIGETWKQGQDEWPDDVTEQDMAPIAGTALGQLSRMEWDSYSNVTRHHFMNNLHPVASKLVDDLVTEGWVDRFQGTMDEHDTWDVAVDLVKRLYPEADDDKLEDMREKGHAMQPENGEEEGNGPGNTNDGDAGIGESLADKDGFLPGEGKVVHWKEAVASQHDEWKPKDPNAPAGSIGIDWTDYTGGRIVLMPQKLVNVVDCRKGGTEKIKDNSYYGSGSPESYMPDNKQSRAFANRIRAYIQSQARVKFDTEKYHGRLDKRSIVKLAMPPIDGGEWNKRLFYQMRMAKHVDTCIHVLTDWSGSMSGVKKVHAADASGRLVQVFDRILHMPVQLAAFSNGHTRCDIGLIKKFTDRSASPLDIASGFSKFGSYTSSNNDADAVMWAYNQIAKRKEKRKILIVLSDGCPAGSWMGGSSNENLKKVTGMIQKEGKVELYGVGICSDAVETYYENNKVLNDASEINATLFEIIKQGVNNGRSRKV